jgi:uncharacterized membrane-anchored protein
MSAEQRLADVVRAAIAQGVLPATATVPRQQVERPWPVVMLTAFGAWLAALPLFAVIGMMFGELLHHAVGAYVVGMLVLAGAVVALRNEGLPLFVEQLVTPTLIVGAGLLGFGLFRDMPMAPAAVVLAVVALAIAIAVPRAWLRVVLGAAAATLLVFAWFPSSDGWKSHAMVHFWVAWHVGLLLWLVAGIVAARLANDGARAAVVAALEPLRAGWLLATLVGLAWWSGMTFLVGATLSSGPLAEIAREIEPALSNRSAMASLRIASLLLAAGAAAWALRCWPTLRSVAGVGVTLVLVVLAWFLPALGATLVALAVCATGKRWRLASTAALAAAWIVGGFYYQLAWPLATKALVLVGAGAALGALAWLSSRSAASVGASASIAPMPNALRWNVGGVALPIDRVGIVATALLVMVAANVAIRQKEQLIATGQPVFVRLAPVDPRSLMQGDYMRLDFALPPQARDDAGGLLDRRRPHVVGRRDARNVVTVLRLHQGEPLAADELRIELTPMHGDWVLVSDAWSFPEGEAARWSRARFGEFRVDANGRALLVGLRGANLEAL